MHQEPARVERLIPGGADPEAFATDRLALTVVIDRIDFGSWR